MTISITSLLSFFLLLSIASVVYFVSRRVKIPYTVMLVATGLILVPISQTKIFYFINDFSLTPEILFYVFLPVLIYESAYAMNIRRLVDNTLSISILSIVSLLISSSVIGVLLYYASGYFNFQIPFIIALLFGSLISATDPVAVLALFKEYGAPRRLSLIFEGESLFNDGTAVALFLVVLDIAIKGFHGFHSVTEGVLTFIIMLCGGIVFGLIAGGIFSKLIEKTRSNELISITLCVVMAHTTFMLSELISSHLIIFGTHIKFSPIIATTVAALVIGNFGRYKFSPHTEEYMEKFWSHGAFIANSIIFLLIGLIFSSLKISLSNFILPIAVSAIIVAFARAVSIYTVIPPLNWLKLEEKIPSSWQALLAWGSLRGALAITMVYLIPDNLLINNWTQPYTPKELLLALTLGCIFVTLFLKALTVGPMIKKLKLDSLTDMEKIEEKHSSAITYKIILDYISRLHNNGYVDTETYEKLKKETETNLSKSMNPRGISEALSENVTERLVKMYALGIEKHFLKQLFARGEINERVYKKIFGKITLQMEASEKGELVTSLSKYRDKKDLFENIFGSLLPIKEFFFKPKEEDIFRDTLEYHRAQSIIARKVVKEFNHLKENSLFKLFDDLLIEKTIKMYETYKESANEKFKEKASEKPNLSKKIKEILARHAVRSIEEETIKDLYSKEMLTPKLFIAWNNLISRDNK